MFAQVVIWAEKLGIIMYFPSKKKKQLTSLHLSDIIPNQFFPVLISALKIFPLNYGGSQKLGGRLLFATQSSSFTPDFLM